ncbi:MAG: HU family DNA-binding protein [Mediterranea sp.]|jgi:predicted histone-like DNA-binding protein|nr:HU family DNA-binding protein [Mediterranea sp.]
MALKYVIKKTTFGFDDKKAEKYVARPFNVVNVDFKKLCNEVTKVAFVPRGTVKAVLDGLIDSLINYMEIGASVSLGEFGTFRPTFGSKSQDGAEGVTADTLKRRRIAFTPGEQLKEMIQKVSIRKLEDAKSPGTGNPVEGNGKGDGKGEEIPEAPEPMV